MATSDAIDRLASETRPVSSPSLILLRPLLLRHLQCRHRRIRRMKLSGLCCRCARVRPHLTPTHFAPPVQVRSLSDYVVRFDPEAALSAAFPGAQVSADRASFNLLLNGEIVPTHSADPGLMRTTAASLRSRRCAASVRLSAVASSFQAPPAALRFPCASLPPKAKAFCMPILSSS